MRSQGLRACRALAGWLLGFAACLPAAAADPPHAAQSPPPAQLTSRPGVPASDTLGVWGQHLLAHADTAQYAAKRSGRHRVHLAPALAELVA